MCANYQLLQSVSHPSVAMVTHERTQLTVALESDCRVDIWIRILSFCPFPLSVSCAEVLEDRAVHVPHVLS